MGARRRRVGRRRPGGEPLIGFLHVPADPETTGDPAPARDRHAALREVVASALRGWREHLPDEGRVLLTGFSAFAGVVDNPTGAFTGDLREVARAVALATGVEARIDAGAVRGQGLEVVSAVLPVDDRALERARAGSLPELLARVRPHAVLSMGVHRVTDHFRVEVVPTSAGLIVDNGEERHTWEARPVQRRSDVRSLARAIVRGSSGRGFALS
ncbi:MAG: hypothetical protein A2138_25750 [Deltaproteobacteria bacterium RBG_16_71_12]|nr:MAG: hypothetical protein A2138_25750 [Deltaproteobacteria bacterium RBG_16_71_12]